MKKLYRIILLSIIMATPAALNGQVLISILFGDALNTEKIEFGLIGGLNRSYIRTISDAEGMNNLNIGFYFHVLMKKSSYLSTGVLVKSNGGATGMPTYLIGDPDFDDVYADGVLTKKIPAFYVPILFHQRFNQRWYIEAGPQLGLIHQPTDIFKIEDHGGDLTYTTSTRGQYQYIDFGFYGALGYKFIKKTKSTSLGIGYYIGLSDVAKDAYPEIKNSSFYLFCKIPIGVGKEVQDIDK
ncbi:MAG: PorT family protein [Bacteroidota bacterium]|nr:PorT family protein [Bacteroidota bacterium]